MAVPFSNTHLRVPRGFGTILEGLAREVLRDQPEDIPKYAAQYFEALLKQREESDVDPSEWAAKLEDRFYNNPVFTSEADPEKEPETEVPISEENSYESQTAIESSQSAAGSELAAAQPNVSEEVDVTEGSEEEDEHDVTEKNDISMEEGLSEEESINRPPTADVQSEGRSGTEEEKKDPTTYTLDRAVSEANEKDISSAPEQDVPQSASTDLSFSGVSNVDVCAQELAKEEYEGVDEQETAVLDKEILDSDGEENTEVEEPVGVVLHPGLAEVEICATELGGTEMTMERATAENHTHTVEEESLDPKPEGTRVQSSLSHSESPEGNHQEAAVTKEEEETEARAASGETCESLAHVEDPLDSATTPKEDSLVEISFEDVPEAQPVAEDGEEQPEEEGSVEVLQTGVLETQQDEEPKEVTAVAADQNITGTQQQDELETEGVENKLNSVTELTESQLEASDIMEENVTTYYSNLIDSGGGDDDDDDDDEEKEEGVEHISSSNQPTTGADTKNPQDETNPTIESIEFTQSEDSEKETKSDGEMTDTVGGDKENVHTEGDGEPEDEDIHDIGAEHHSTQVTPSREGEGERETLGASAQHLSEESRGTLVEADPEDTADEKETHHITSEEAENVREEGNIHSEVEERSDAMCEEESIGFTHVSDGTADDHQGEETPLGSEKDPTEPEQDKSTAQQEECSRPQEEEDIMDIPLDDPEANRAAAKIQAGFRGHMTRKKMKPEDKAEGEEVSSTGDVLNGGQGDAATGGSGAVESDDTSVPEQ